MNLADLVAAKRALGHSISVCLPARNEAATVGAIVREVRERADRRRRASSTRSSCIDDGSTDATAEVARAAGARVVAEAERAPRGRARARARATRSGSRCTRARATSSAGSTPTSATSAPTPSRSCVEPLIADADTVLVKASYTRSFEGAPTGGGRVTELVARPLLSLLFPKLADIVQPLGGEYAARRDALEVLPFVEGWGVELGLLVDVVERFGRDAVAQVDLGTREHRNRPVDELAAQSLAIIATALRRAGLMQFDGPTLELAARRPRRQRRSRARRDPRTPPDRDHPRLPPRAPADHSNRRESAVSTDPSHAGSIVEGGAAGFYGGFLDEERGAGVGLAGLPDAVGEREHLDAGAVGERGARVVGDLAGDHRDARHARGRRAHASTPPTTLPSRLDASSLPSPVTTSVAPSNARFETDRFRDRVEAGHELRADRREPAGQPAGRAAAGERGHVDAGARAVLVGDAAAAGA